MTDLGIERELEQSAIEVLEKMFFISALPAALPAGQPPAEPISIEIGFQGEPAGCLSLEIAPDAADSIAANFLGLEPSGVDLHLATEVACELANMICGAVLSRIESTATFRLSTPRVTAGPRLPAPSGQPANLGVVCLDTGDGLLALRIETESPI